MKIAELLQAYDQIALRIRCCQDSMRRIFDSMDNDNPDAVDRIYMRGQMQHAQDYLSTAQRLLAELDNLATARSINDIRDGVKRSDAVLINLMRPKPGEHCPSEISVIGKFDEAEMTVSEMCGQVQELLEVFSSPLKGG